MSKRFKPVLALVLSLFMSVSTLSKSEIKAILNEAKSKV